MKLFGKKNKLPDVQQNDLFDDNLKNIVPSDFDYQKAWNDGFVLTVDKKMNPQELSDIYSNLYENNNKWLTYAAGGCVILIILITSATHLAFLSIKEPRFFTTTPSGHVEMINTKTSPTKLSRIPGNKEVEQMTKEYFAENIDKVKWFYGDKPKKLNLSFAHNSEGSDNNKAISEQSLKDDRAKEEVKRREKEQNQSPTLYNMPRVVQPQVQAPINTQVIPQRNPNVVTQGNPSGVVVNQLPIQNNTQGVR